MNTASKRGVQELLAKHGLSPQKRFGQNFLIDLNILNIIVGAADIARDDYIIEIGPGLGVLTRELCVRAKNVVAVEIDKKLIGVLEQELEEFGNLRLIQGDVMKMPMQGLVPDTSSAKIVANLPYNITTPFICECLAGCAVPDAPPLTKIVVMVQKEAAERFLAKPGSKAYGAATLTAACFADAKLVATVPPSCFYPVPDVTSAVLMFDILSKPRIDAQNRGFVFDLIRAAFSTRRKTLVNCLAQAFPELTKARVAAALEQMGLDVNIRGEVLRLEQFEQLSGFFC